MAAAGKWGRLECDGQGRHCPPYGRQLASDLEAEPDCTSVVVPLHCAMVAIDFLVWLLGIVESESNHQPSSSTSRGRQWALNLEP